MRQITCHSSYDPDKNIFFLYIEGCVKDSIELKKFFDCASEIELHSREHKVWTVCDFTKAELPSMVYMKMIAKRLLELAENHSYAEVCATGTSDIIAGVSIFRHFTRKAIKVVKTLDEAYAWVEGQQLFKGMFPNEKPDHG
jgi:hypothetical protein